MGYVTKTVLFLVFLAAVFQRSIFLAEDVIFPKENVDSAQESSCKNDVLPDGSSHSVKSNDAVTDILNNKIADDSPVISPSLATAPSSPDVLAALPDLVFNQYSNNFVASAFHPPLVRDFWNVFLHQQNHLQRVRSGPLAETVKKAEKISSTSTAEGGKGVDEDMPPFEEWRQRRLQDAAKEKHDQQTVTNHTGKRRQRPVKNTNYASVICGAKVVAHNAELENPGAILTANRDDYMLNPCKAARKYFVVELCESIHVHGFDIGNMELFSNVPKTIHVFGSARYPTREWIDFGKFDLKEARTMQSFEVPITATGFVKFIRVEMLEHYGKEHYCPITVFRAFGTSMVEEYVESVDDDEANSADSQTDPGVEDTAVQSEDADIERDKWGQGLTENHFHVSPITMAKDIVVNFVKKAASSGYNFINGAGQNSTPAPCRNTTAVISSLRSNLTDIHNSTPSSGVIAPSSPLLSLCFDPMDGWDVATVSCQYVWCLFQASNASLSFCPGVGNATRLAHLSSCDPQPDDLVDLTSRADIPVSHSTAIPNSTGTDEVFHPVPASMDDGNVSSVGDSHMPKFASANEKDQQKSFPTGILPTFMDKDHGKVVEEEPKENITVPIRPVRKSVNDTETTVISTNSTTTTAVPVPSITNGVPGQKESVFVRLGNRLKTLELNMSLSGQYLHELSRRFKKQSDESAKNFTVMSSKLLELNGRKDSDLLGVVVARLRDLETVYERLEVQTTAMQIELRFLRWMVPLLSAVSLFLLLISLAIGLVWLPRYIRNQVVQATRLQQRHAQTNGHLKVSSGVVAPVTTPAAPLPLTWEEGTCSESGLFTVKRKHKRHKKSHATGEVVLSGESSASARLVPGLTCLTTLARGRPEI